MLHILLAAAITVQCSQPPLKYLRWEGEIRGIEKRLADTPPAKGGVVFAGSSSIRLWDVAKAFPDVPAANVGFGGSQIPDCTFFVNRLVVPLEPKAVVFYAGDNDINGGRSPEQVRDDFAAFATAVHAKLPKCRVLFLSVKPSGSRWKHYEKQQKANGLVKELCGKDARLGYVDVGGCLLGSDGKPDPELFVKDQLHLSPKGYEKWNAVLKEHLK
jgi:GDSL-like Lipase/Acylhydrolase family